MSEGGSALSALLEDWSRWCRQTGGIGPQQARAYSAESRWDHPSRHHWETIDQRIEAGARKMPPPSDARCTAVEHAVRNLPALVQAAVRIEYVYCHRPREGETDDQWQDRKRRMARTSMERYREHVDQAERMLAHIMGV